MATMILTVLLMILASAEQPAATQPQTQPDPPGPATAPSEEDAEFASLRKAYGNLYSSLRARGGIADEDLEATRSFRDRVATFNEQWPDHERALAIELQLSGWLKDHDRVHQVFARLAELRADDFRFGLAWANFFVQINDRDRAEEIFARLAELYPDNVEVRLAWVEYLRGLNRYGPAIEILKSDAFNLTELPRAALLLSDCLFAEHRFQEALDVLLSISQETLAEDVAVSQQVQAALPDRQEYVELWVQEQEIRLAEEVADDLPRAELITARGRRFLRASRRCEHHGRIRRQMGRPRAVPDRGVRRVGRDGLSRTGRPAQPAPLAFSQPRRRSAPLCWAALRAVNTAWEKSTPRDTSSRPLHWKPRAR